MFVCFCALNQQNVQYKTEQVKPPKQLSIFWIQQNSGQKAHKSVVLIAERTLKTLSKIG